MIFHISTGYAVFIWILSTIFFLLFFCIGGKVKADCEGRSFRSHRPSLAFPSLVGSMPRSRRSSEVIISKPPKDLPATNFREMTHLEVVNE
ncbi:Oidioi.mRNA.OKI2018_I69.XSR.g14149.t1.cds [Oikopleura dioica]|uniref:Oidioi.mRNA.OKI2018_I69.XSR.g14149.t1.cds n=1 Tax=Oikopleura dioica TaxID=34765 RepID=A0ABN7SCV0_OIKDI|nr:Oidioi.mRNA.OKI2018_I69.XSR.g14149.t1.cds [Oikopleura dioica]